MAKTYAELEALLKAEQEKNKKLNKEIKSQYTKLQNLKLDVTELSNDIDVIRSKNFMLLNERDDLAQKYNQLEEWTNKIKDNGDKIRKILGVTTRENDLVSDVQNQFNILAEQKQNFQDISEQMINKMESLLQETNSKSQEELIFKVNDYKRPSMIHELNSEIETLKGTIDTLSKTNKKYLQFIQKIGNLTQTTAYEGILIKIQEWKFKSTAFKKDKVTTGFLINKINELEAKINSLLP